MLCSKIEIKQGYKKGCLDSPKYISFKFRDYNIELEQQITRLITISSSYACSIDELYKLFCSLERLIFLLEGQFLEIKEIHIYDENQNETENCRQLALNLMNSRLNYYDTIDFLKNSSFYLVPVFDALNEVLLNDWISLESELDIVNQIFLYSISNIGLPVDGKVAYLIESFESLADIIKQRTSNLQTNNLAKMSLKDCIKEVIKIYGNNIFSDEINKNFDNFLDLLVNSRVNIMHIKLHKRTPYLTGPEACLYIGKISLLYRSILFELLHINNTLYTSKLNIAVKKLNDWNNILDDILIKVQ